MPIMMEKLYDALRGVAGEDKARAAAVEAAEFDARITKIDADLMLLKWMVGFNLALSAAILLKMFLP
jgi:hypothetical protein